MTKELNTVRKQESDVQGGRQQTLETPQWHAPHISLKAAQAIDSDTAKNSTSYPLPKLSIGDMFGAPINSNAFFKKQIESNKETSLPTERAFVPKLIGQTQS